MSFWRDLLKDIKSLAVLHEDVRRLETRVEKIDDRVTRHGERLAHIEGIIGWAQSQPRLPS
jgi:hypothetical protein